jgi:hypothetical protein
MDPPPPAILAPELYALIARKGTLIQALEQLSNAPEQRISITDLPQHTEFKHCVAMLAQDSMLPLTQLTNHVYEHIKHILPNADLLEIRANITALLQRKFYAVRSGKVDNHNEDTYLLHKWVWEAKDLDCFPKDTVDTLKKYRKLRKLVSVFLLLGSDFVLEDSLVI